MKKTLSLLLCAALALSALAGCGPKETPDVSGSGSSASQSAPDVSAPDASDPDVSAEGLPNLLVLSGPTGVGAAKLMADNETSPVFDQVQVVTDNTEVSTALVNGGAAIAAMATNAAANLSASGVLRPEETGAAQLSQALTLGQAAELLDGALDVAAAREDGWFPW